MKEALHEARHKHEKSLKKRRNLRVFLLIFVVLATVNVVVVGLSNRRPARPRVIQGPQSYDGKTCIDTAPRPWDERPSFGISPKRIVKSEKKYTAFIDTNCGKIDIALDLKNAPQAVNNFVFLVDKNSFYDGLTWHRVVDDFVIQGGDPKGTGNGGPGYAFEDELPKGEQCRRDTSSGRLLCYPKGTVAMANSGADTNGSQFFIVTGGGGDNLEPNYTVFGKVIKGMAVVDKLASFAQPDLSQDDPNFQKPSRSLYIYRVRIRDE